MNVMWVTMAPIGNMSNVLYGRKTQSGGWIDSTFNCIKSYIQEGKIELHIVALSNDNLSVKSDNENVTYHTINIERFRGKEPSKNDFSKWKEIIAKINPDIIQVWGTEFSFGKSIKEAAGKIPVCYYIQGVMSALANHPAGDIPLNKLNKIVGPTALLKFRSMKKEIKSNVKHVKLENDIIRSADGILCDNEWTKAQYNSYTNKFYDVSLALNQCFIGNTWSVDNCEKYTLFTVAGGASPIKGIHNVVLALKILKEKYPNIKLKIPGNISSRKPHFLYDTIFIRHLKKLINENDLKENVIFLGQLTPSQMAEQMLSANAFVMPSCVETHSSSMREAMSIGCPTISAVVGSVLEFAKHDENAFLYRYDDVNSLAYYIEKIFDNHDLAAKLSINASKDIKEKYPQEEIGKQLYDAYTKIINESKD